MKPALITLFLLGKYALRIILVLARMTVFTKQFWAINLTITLNSELRKKIYPKPNQVTNANHVFLIWPL